MFFDKFAVCINRQQPECVIVQPLVWRIISYRLDVLLSGFLKNIKENGGNTKEKMTNVIKALSTGSEFINVGTSATLNLLCKNTNMESEVSMACEKIKDRMKKEGSIDLPMIIQELHISVDIAIKAINKLRSQGQIKLENEF